MPHRLLIIDDSPLEIRYIKLLIEIEELPIEVTFQSMATDALDYLKNVDASLFPQVIITDLNMPLINGFEFVEQFDQQFAAQYPDTSIFMFSSSPRLTDIKKAKTYTAVKDFVNKPVTKEFLEGQAFPSLAAQPSDSSNDNF